jgi:riboflavin biosynthesis pyrimidine reductase
MRFLQPERSQVDAVITEHVALPADRPRGRALVRLNMISSADGGAAVGGVSGGLGNDDDRAVFAALRAHSEAVIVGLSTAVAERYRPPKRDDLELCVCASRPDVSAMPELFTSDRVTLVIPEDAAPAPDHVRVRRAGRGRVDPTALSQQLAGKVALAEGGPRLAGAFAAAGQIDELFVTIAPRVVAGDAPRIMRGPAADPGPWTLTHGFADDDGFVFLRYARRTTAS